MKAKGLYVCNHPSDGAIGCRSLKDPESRYATKWDDIANQLKPNPATWATVVGLEFHPTDEFPNRVVMFFDYGD